MRNQFEKQNFGRKLKSMLRVDFRRAFTMPLVYIMAGISFVIPVLILVMTSLLGNAEEGAEAAATFTNVWQAIGSTGGSATAMDITGMCNINLLYFLIAIFVCIFVAEDFRSGYAKNLFTVRSKRIDYCVSKTAAGFVGGVIMVIVYFVGAMIGGAIAGFSFDTAGFGAGGIVACLFSKIFLVAVFAAIALTLGVVAKQRLWLSILCSLAAGALLFTMLPMISPLNSTFLNVIMCFAGGALFAVGLGAVSTVILRKTNLV